MHIADLDRLFTLSDYELEPSMTLLQNASSCIHERMYEEGILGDHDSVEVYYDSGTFRIIIDQAEDYDALLEKIEKFMVRMRSEGMVIR